MSLTLIFTLLMGFAGGNSVFAASEDTYKIEKESEVTYQFLPADAMIDDIGTQGAVATIVIFIGGTVGAWLIDGVLIYNTGYTGSELVAKGLDYFYNNPGCKEVQVTNAGRTFCGSGTTF